MKQPHSPSPKTGFALVVCLTLMVLLVIISLSLLTLSASSLRRSGTDSEMARARANARLALSMAIAQLQKNAGDDRRITMTADQRMGSGDGTTTSTPSGKTGWTGVYRSWGPDEGTDPDAWPDRPAPEFLSWLVSGPGSGLEDPASSTASAAEITLVGEGTLGIGTGKAVRVESISLSEGNESVGSLAWWTGDQGVKAAFSLPDSGSPDSVTAARASMQAPERLDFSSSGEGNPFSETDFSKEKTGGLLSWKQLSLVSASPASSGPLFHDIASHSTGLLTDVRHGGFRKDLSLLLARRPERSDETYYLYEIDDDPGINLEELYHFYSIHEDLTAASGARFLSPGPALAPDTLVARLAATPKDCMLDPYHYYKMPLVTAYELVMSFQVKELTVAFNEGGKSVNRKIPALHLVVDPIITFWNPLDVPVVIPQSTYFSFKYWQVPVDVDVEMGGTTWRCPLLGSVTRKDGNFLSIKIGNQGEPLVLRPGEVLKTSQTRTTIHKDQHQTDHNIQGSIGFNHGGGVAYPLRDMRGMKQDGKHYIDTTGHSTFTYQVRPNEFTSGSTEGSGEVLPGYATYGYNYALTMVGMYLGNDRGGYSEQIGGAYLDSLYLNSRRIGDYSRASGRQLEKDDALRYRATDPILSDVFQEISGRTVDIPPLQNLKQPFAMAAFRAKTEEDTSPRSRGLRWYNPVQPMCDFFDMTKRERTILSHAYTFEPVDSWKDSNFEVTPDGRAYFGGGMSAQTGNTAVITHSIPRAPVFSLGAFQHSMANGFDWFGKDWGFRRGMFPITAQAIGNSLAYPIIEPEKMWARMAGGQVAADHSYLANRRLWDDYFLSSIAPGTSPSSRSQRDVAEDFFNLLEPLPNRRYLAEPATSADDLMSKLFDGDLPTPDAHEIAAAHLRVEGLFNVNSTSLEAWKSVLSSLRESKPPVQSTGGDQSIGAIGQGTDSGALLTPVNLVMAGDDKPDVLDPQQWIGRRLLTDDQVESLAREIVKQVRKRGPFLSLADFVNRRLDTDPDLARAGTLQAAIDAPDCLVNEAFNQRNESELSGEAFLEFAKAETGPLSTGIPGVVKQGDLLTSLAPFISVRSDSFLIRAYGESIAKNGRVTARAWCEATVRREATYLDGADEPHLAPPDLTSPINREMGRRFTITSFRWMNQDEI